ncbi:HNH endonuclease [Paenibacillus wynnii]|uniref:HNH endonuclease n=1 Tax=Paenibacillus wynnii TaxID=268407 RepID=UPI0006898B82|nr:hypothetical protein [Paenibacillus wynnii]
MTHQTFWKPEKQEKPKKTSSLGQHKKEKKVVSEWKRDLFAGHTPGKSSADRAEFPRKIVAELIAEAGEVCQHCRSAPDTTTHHVWPRGRKGRGVKTNGLRLCGLCHDLIQTTDELLQYWIGVFRDRYGEYFWYDELDWEEHNRKMAAQEQSERELEVRRQQIEPVADLITTAAGRPLRVKELQLLQSLEPKALQVFTGMITDSLNGYASQGTYRALDRFED